MTALAERPVTARGDARTASRWLAAALLPFGPAAVAVLRYVLPYDTVDTGAEVVRKVAADPGAQSLAIWLGLVGILTLVPAVFWVGRLTRRGAPWLTAAALFLLAPGYIALGLLVAQDAMLWQGVRDGVDPALLAGAYDAGHPALAASTGVFVAGHVLGTVLLGVAMWRSGAVPRWAAVVVALAQPLHIVSVVLASHPLDLFAWGLNAAGFAAAGLAILRLRNDDWDLPPR